MKYIIPVESKEQYAAKILNDFILTYCWFCLLFNSYFIMKYQDVVRTLTARFWLCRCSETL